MPLNTDNLRRCIDALEKSLVQLNEAAPNTAHDYGEGFANETLKQMPGFLKDARRLEAALSTRFKTLDEDDARA